MGFELSKGNQIVMIVVFLIYTVGMLLVGFWQKRRMDRHSTAGKYVDSFYTGGRGMGALLVAMMVAASIVGSGTFIGCPGTTYRTGLGFGVLVMGQSFMNLTVLGFIGKKVNILSRRDNIQSFVGIFHSRYRSKAVNVLMTMAIIIFVGVYTASQFIAGGRLFEVMTGMPYEIGITFFVVVVLVVARFGGVKGIAIGTVVQGFLMTFAVFLMFFVGMAYVGGGEAALTRLAAMDPSLVSAHINSPQMSLSFMMNFGFFSAAFPHAAIGAFTYKNTRSVHNAVRIGVIFVATWSFLVMLLSGVVRDAFPALPVSDYAIPAIIAASMPSWASGLTLAGIAGALQSTIATMVIVITSSVIKDMYATVIKPSATDEQIQKGTKIGAVVVTIAVYLLSLFPPDNMQVLVNYAIGGMSSAFWSPLILGIYWKRATKYGAMASVVGGLGIYILLSSGVLPAGLALGMQPLVVSNIIAFVLMVAVSLATPKSPYGIIQTWFAKEYQPAAPAPAEAQKAQAEG